MVCKLTYLQLPAILDGFQHLKTTALRGGTCTIAGLTQNPQLRDGAVQAEEHPERAGVVHAHLHAHVGGVVAEDDLPLLVDQEAQDVGALEGRGDAAHRPELLPVTHTGLRVSRISFQVANDSKMKESYRELIVILIV